MHATNRERERKAIEKKNNKPLGFIDSAEFVVNWFSNKCSDFQVGEDTVRKTNRNLTTKGKTFFDETYTKRTKLKTKNNTNEFKKKRNGKKMCFFLSS